MKKDINYKIRNILSKDESNVAEADVQHLFSLMRKLVERMPRREARKYSLLKFYCDWTVHVTLDRKTEATAIIQQAESIIKKHLKPGANDTQLSKELTQLLTLAKLRTQINDISQDYGEPIGDAQWNRTVDLLIEIISDCTLEVRKQKKSVFHRAVGYVRHRKGDTKELAVEKVSISKKIPARVLGIDSDDLSYYMVITLNNTTHIVVPLENIR